MEKLSSRDFGKYESEAHAEIQKIETSSAATSHVDIQKNITILSDNLARMYAIASETLDRGQDKKAVDAQKRAEQALRDLDTRLGHSPTDSLKTYFSQRLAIYEAGYQLSRRSEIQTDLVQSAKGELDRVQTVLGWPELQTDATEVGKFITDNKLLTNDAGVFDKDEFGDNSAVGLKSEYDLVLDIMSRVNAGTALHFNGSPIKDVVDQLPTIFSAAGQVAEGEVLDSGRITKLEEVNRVLAENENTYRVDPNVVADIRRLRKITSRLEHESNINEVGRGLYRDEYMRPSDKKIKDDIYGEVQMITGQYAQQIREAEVVGLDLARSPTAKIPEEKIAKLKKFQFALEKEIEDYISAAANIGTPLPTTVQDKIRDLGDEIQNYINWVGRLISVAETRGARKEAGQPIELTAQFRPVAETQEMWEAIDHLVTLDFTGNDTQQIVDAFMERARRLREKGEPWSYVAEVYDLIPAMYADGTMKKGEVLDLDWLTVNWDKAKADLGSANPVGRYDMFRQTYLYRTCIRPLSDRVFEKMLDRDSKWFAASDWSKPKSLMIEAHEDLYYGYDVKDKDGNVLGPPPHPSFPPDPIYKSIIDKFPPGPGKDNKEDAIQFMWNMAWYETSLNDLRTEASSIMLGVLKKTYKQRGGQPPDGTAALDNAAYQAKMVIWADMQRS